MRNRVILIACVLAGSVWAPYVTAKERGAQEERAAEIVASNCVIHTTRETDLRKVTEMDADDVWISNLTNGEEGWIRISYAFAGSAFSAYYNLNSGQIFCGAKAFGGRIFQKAPGDIDFFASGVAQYFNYDDGMLCRAALAGGGTRWETNPTWLPAIREAQKRGLSVEDCRNIGGL